MRKMKWKEIKRRYHSIKIYELNINCLSTYLQIKFDHIVMMWMGLLRRNFGNWQFYPSNPQVHLTDPSY